MKYASYTYINKSTFARKLNLELRLICDRIHKPIHNNNNNNNNNQKII